MLCRPYLGPISDKKARCPFRIVWFMQNSQMTRVEWTRLDGADVEAVVAMFVNREHPNSTRITFQKATAESTFLTVVPGQGAAMSSTR